MSWILQSVSISHISHIYENCEDDQPISSEMDSNILYISSAIHPLTNEPLSIRSCLLELRRGWNHRLRRYSMTEQDYFSAYQAYLEKVASSRVELVHRWLKINTERFVENAEIKDLFRTFENLVKELRMAILPCGAPCSTCNLLCLEQRYHEGKHDCATKHKCPTICGFTDQHEVSKIPSCDMPLVFYRLFDLYDADYSQSWPSRSSLVCLSLFWLETS